MGIGKRTFNASHEVNATLLSAVNADSASLAYGEHLAITLGCMDCHAENLGGTIMVDAPPFQAVGANLTSGTGGVGSAYSVADWDRAIRYGVRPDGTAMLIMPSKAYHNLSDADTEDLIAYLQSIPPVDNTLPPSELRPLGAILSGTGAADFSSNVVVEANRKPAPEKGVTAAYGAYLASRMCTYCHGDDLRGAPAMDPSMPLGTDLASFASRPIDAFSASLREGLRSDGEIMNAEYMPWTSTRHMTDEEIEAMYLYIKEVAG